MLAYSNGSQFCFTAELQSPWLVRWAMRRRTPHPTTPNWVIRSWELKWHEQWGGTPNTTLPTPLVIRSWELKWHKQWGSVSAYWDPAGSASFHIGSKVKCSKVLRCDLDIFQLAVMTYSFNLCHYSFQFSYGKKATPHHLLNQKNICWKYGLSRNRNEYFYKDLFAQSGLVIRAISDSA